jgi:hypothetical protein
MAGKNDGLMQVNVGSGGKLQTINRNLRSENKGDSHANSSHA